MSAPTIKITIAEGTYTRNELWVNGEFILSGDRTFVAPIAENLGVALGQPNIEGL